MNDDTARARRIVSRGLSRFAGNMDPGGGIAAGGYSAAWCGLSLLLFMDDAGAATLTVVGFMDDAPPHTTLTPLFEAKWAGDEPLQVTAWRGGAWEAGFMGYDA